LKRSRLRRSPEGGEHSGGGESEIYDRRERKELERGKERQRRREEPTPTLVKQNRNFSLFPYPHHRRGQLKALS